MTKRRAGISGGPEVDTCLAAVGCPASQLREVEAGSDVLVTVASRAFFGSEAFLSLPTATGQCLPSFSLSAASEALVVQGAISRGRWPRCGGAHGLVSVPWDEGPVMCSGRSPGRCILTTAPLRRSGCVRASPGSLP